MTRRHRRVWGTAAAFLVLVWGIAWGGYRWALNSRMTAAKLRQHIESVDFAKLEGDARAQALQELARRLNGLSLEERRRFRLEGSWNRWFDAMTDEEKGTFIEATLPTGFKQMLTAFEQMPEQNRRTAVDEALKRMREASEQVARDEPGDFDGSTNRPPELPEDVRQKAVKLGLKTYYSESSARTKAELAPVLEEIQQMMESGRFFRGRHHE